MSRGNTIADRKGVCATLDYVLLEAPVDRDAIVRSVLRALKTAPVWSPLVSQEVPSDLSLDDPHGKREATALRARLSGCVAPQLERLVEELLWLQRLGAALQRIAANPADWRSVDLNLDECLHDIPSVACCSLFESIRTAAELNACIVDEGDFPVLVTRGYAYLTLQRTHTYWHSVLS